MKFTDFEVLTHWQYPVMAKDKVPGINYDKVNKLRARGIKLGTSRVRT